MKRSIVIVIVDEGGIVRYKKRLVPWSLFFWNPYYSRVIEFEEDDSSVKGINLGSKLTIVVQETL